MAGRIKVTTARLLQIAGGIFVTGSFGLYLAQNAVQSKVRKFPHYSEAFEIISQHEKLMDTLGTPIRVGKVDLADRTSNYVAVTDSKVITVTFFKNKVIFFSFEYRSQDLWEVAF